MTGLHLPDRTLRIPCVLARGGTSRGVLVRRQDLPEDKSINVTMCVAVTAAAAHGGTVLDRLCREGIRAGRLRVGHPSGVVETCWEMQRGGGSPALRSVSLGRTARLILRGELLVQPYKRRHLASLRDRRGVGS